MDQKAQSSEKFQPPVKEKGLILICGGNRDASAIALKLYRSGYPILIFTHPDESYLRYNLSFGDAVHRGQKVINGITAEILSARALEDPTGKSLPEKIRNAALFLLKDRKIPVLNQLSIQETLEIFQPSVVFNILPPGTISLKMGDVPLLIALYPDHVPGVDCDLSIEGRLNYHLGEIYLPDSIIPVKTEFDTHLFKNPFAECPTPIEGVWITHKKIGDEIHFNEALGSIGEIEIRSPYDGQIWGLAHSGRFVAARCSVALIYQGFPTDAVRSFGFWHHAVAGAALEAIQRFWVNS